MKFQSELIYLGYSIGTSKKTGNSYSLVKLMDQEEGSIFEMYVPADKVGVTTKLDTLQQYTPHKVTFKMSSFNNKPQVDLEDLEESKKK